MKLEINTSSKAVEVANMILGQGIKSIEENPHIQKAFDLSDTDLKNAKAFRKALLKSFTGGRLIIKT